jgi:L-ribulose-5-phosphate 4-epimerase
MLEELRQQVCDANQRLVAEGLVTLTWGNVSAIDRESGLVAIKPSGVAYDKLTAESIVLVDLDGNRVEGAFNPSSDTPTHVMLYRHFESVGGITHTHSPWATAFAQARVPIPCLGTTHADHFHGSIPVTRPLSVEEIEQGYERNTGAVILEALQGLDPVAVPAVLLAGHAPFTWGRNAMQSVENAVALEAVAQMASTTLSLTDKPIPLEAHVCEKHYARKHGPHAYYGQGS